MSTRKEAIRKRLPEEGRKILLSAEIVLFLECGFTVGTANESEANG